MASQKRIISCARWYYYHVAKDDYLVRSGELEVATKVLVTQRLKRSGQIWHRDGGQGVLAYCALLKPEHFDRAWNMVVPGIGAGQVRMP